MRDMLATKRRSAKATKGGYEGGFPLSACGLASGCAHTALAKPQAAESVSTFPPRPNQRAQNLALIIRSIQFFQRVNQLFPRDQPEALVHPLPQQLQRRPIALGELRADPTDLDQSIAPALHD